MSAAVTRPVDPVLQAIHDALPARAARMARVAVLAALTPAHHCDALWHAVLRAAWYRRHAAPIVVLRVCAGALCAARFRPPPPQGHEGIAGGAAGRTT